LKIENALTVRCGRIHEDEKRGPAREPGDESTPTHTQKAVLSSRRRCLSKERSTTHMWQTKRLRRKVKKREREIKVPKRSLKTGRKVKKVQRMKR
jgi:hypothetical protein